jgi:MOSC domain-containing protein YiiM
MSEGRLAAIWVKRMKLGPMDAVETARLIAGRGIVGNANQGGRRQVTIIERERWENFRRRFESSLSPSTRRANLMVEGIDLTKRRGQILQIGECQIRILGETKPCERMDEALPGLKEAMYPDWGGGAFGEVLNNGQITVGDQARWMIEA